MKDCMGNELRVGDVAMVVGCDPGDEKWLGYVGQVIGDQTPGSQFVCDCGDPRRVWLSQSLYGCGCATLKINPDDTSKDQSVSKDRQNSRSPEKERVAKV